LDQRRRTATQNPFEGEDARSGGRESDEANGGCCPAKGQDDRHWSWSSPLRIVTMMGSPKCGGSLRAFTYPGRLARAVIKPLGMQDSTLTTRREQIGNKLHPTREVDSTRVAAVRPRVSARSGPANRRPAPARNTVVTLRCRRGGRSASRRGATARRRSRRAFCSRDRCSHARQGALVCHAIGLSAGARASRAELRPRHLSRRR
jgi:hypothetical protein